MHVTGHDVDLRPALSREPAAVIVPSAVVPREAAARGYDTSTWRIVPNALLTETALGDEQRREHLRSHGPVRVLARLGSEKGIGQLLGTSPQLSRPVQVALADAAFEGTGVTQRQLLDECCALAASHPGVTIMPARTWSQAPRWLGAAALVIVPSLAETFGLVALEAMSQGTPVVARAVGNLPDLIGDGGVLVPARNGPACLWRAARHLLADPVSYHRKSRAAYYLSRDYRPARVASQLLKVVS